MKPSDIQTFETAVDCLLSIACDSHCPREEVGPRVNYWDAVPSSVKVCFVPGVMLPVESTGKFADKVHILQAFTAAGAQDPDQVKRNCFGAWRCASHCYVDVERCVTVGMRTLRDILHLLASAWEQFSGNEL